jgi:hypothetical protein
MLGAKPLIISLALIAVLAVLGLIFVGLSQRLPSQEQQGQNQQEPASQHAPANEKMPAEKNYQSSGWAKIKQAIERNEKVVTALSSAIIAAFTVALVLATGFLYFSSEKVADAAKESAEAAKGALISAERSSTSDRAWLFVKLNSRSPIKRKPGSHSFFVESEFQIENFGKTPSVITKIDGRLFWNIGHVAEPDPETSVSSRASWTVLQEKEHGTMLPSGRVFPNWEGNDTRLPANPVFLRAQQILVVKGQFSFEKQELDIPDDAPLEFVSVVPEPVKYINGAPAIPARYCGDFWLYVVLNYKDTYGIDRETSYFTKIFSINVAQPVEEQHQKYNYWK